VKSLQALLVISFNQEEQFDEEITMNKRKLWWALMISFLFLLAMVNIGFTQTKDQGAPVAKRPAVPITTVGKIVYLADYGGYIIRRTKPHEEYKIVNQDKTILSEYEKKGEPVKVEGNLQLNYLLTIDTINGQEYPGKK
jgi:hypothetical protein